MKVLVDARSLGSGRGIARYARRMLEAAAAAAVGSDEAWDAVLPADGPPDATLPAGVGVHRGRLPSRAMFGLAAATGRPRLDVVGGGADVVWLPAVAPVAVGRGVPVVVTVHDLSFLTRPQDFTAYERAWHRVARPAALVQRAAAVVCDTDAVAQEVTARWPAVAGRVRVVVPGVDRPPVRTAAVPDGLPARFFLWVGALEPRKAPEVVAAAFARAQQAGLDAGLVVAGAGREAGRLTGPGVVPVGAVDDATLHALYGAALALVMPSRLEGFGLPPLEAALHGTPSIVTDLPAFAQTLPGDSVERVPVDDVPALADALLRLAGDEGHRVALGERARAAVAPLTWARAADELRTVLRESAR